MNFTTGFNLPCPEGTDMAAVALYMQCLAEQVEGSLGEQSDAFTTFLNPPVAFWSNTATQTGMVSRDLFTFNTVASNNWPTVPSSTSPALPNLRGWWYIGANVNIIDNSAPIANRYRAIILTATQNAGITSEPVLTTLIDTVQESATAGGENPLVAGTLFFASGDFSAPAPVDLALQYRTDDLPANTQDTTLTPPIRLWAVFLGDTPQIGAV